MPGGTNKKQGANISPACVPKRILRPPNDRGSCGFMYWPIDSRLPGLPFWSRQILRDSRWNCTVKSDSVRKETKTLVERSVRYDINRSIDLLSWRWKGKSVLFNWNAMKREWTCLLVNWKMKDEFSLCSYKISEDRNEETYLINEME